MDAIISALKEEKKQADRLMNRYQKELKKLPNGSFFTRRRGERTYCYLTYSVAGKVKQDYLGRLSDDKIQEYLAMMKRKKKLKELIKKTEKQKSFLEKSINHARKKG